jgi:hypothetical protein
LTLFVERIGASFYNTPLRTSRFRNDIVVSTAASAALSPLLWLTATVIGLSLRVNQEFRVAEKDNLACFDLRPALDHVQLCLVLWWTSNLD